MSNSTYFTHYSINLNYQTDMVMVMASALLFSIFLAGLLGLLTGKFKSLSYVPLIDRNSGSNAPAVKASSVAHEQKTTEVSLYRELSCHELNLLFYAADLKGKQIISLLLSGLTLDETASLKADQVDLEMSTITVFGGVLRTLPMSSTLKKLFEQADKYPVWDGIKPMSFDDMQRSLATSAKASGLIDFDTICAEAIRHSYIMHLLSLGIPVLQLSNFIGYLDASELMYYRKHFNVQTKYTVNDKDLIHPLFSHTIV